MKKKLYIIFMILIIIIISVIIAINMGKNYIKTTKGIVVRVNNNSLDVIILDDKSLSSVSFSKDGGIGFKQGQEVLIYYDGTIATSYPSQIHNVGKIKILKEKSDIKIPNEVLRYYYSSYKNVKIYINELTNTQISFDIEDNNEIPYEYSDNYKIYRKNYKAENVQIDTNRIIPGTGNSTSSYMRT